MIDSSSKKDRFLWKGGSRSSSEEILYRPNFEYDAEQIIILANNNDDGSLKQRLIDQRIDALSSLLFRPITAEDGRPDNAIVDFVFNGRLPKQVNDERHPISGFSESVSSPERRQEQQQQQQQQLFAHEEHHKNDIFANKNKSLSDDDADEQIFIQKTYHDRRREQRHLANIYLASRRRIVPEPAWVVENGEQDQQGTVQIDRHGRLVRTRRRESVNNDNVNNDDDDERGVEGSATNRNGNDGNEELELVDAAETFWRQHKKKGQGTTSGGRRAASVSNTSLAPLQQQQPPAIPQHPLNEQHIRERTITQHLEDESRRAMERAIHRYRVGQQQQLQRDEAVFEMIHIPLVRPINNVNVPRWLRFLSLPQQQQQQQNANRNAGDNHNRDQQQNHPIDEQNHHQQNNDGRDWIDLRLALRRICFAVITVVAAFLCMMLQGLPTVDFGDDGVEYVDAIFLSEIMGGHYRGRHSQRHHHHGRQHQRRRRKQHPELNVRVSHEMSEEGGRYQGISWNQLILEDDVGDYNGAEL